mgnify:CR=1 FL=1
MFKLIAGLYTEYINFYKMCQACSVENVVKDFIAFNIIVEIDDIMVQMLSVDMTENIDQAKIDFRKNNMEMYKPSEMQFLAKSLYKLFKWFYEVIYFYYFPILVIVVCYYFGDQVTVIAECDDWIWL